MMRGLFLVLGCAFGFLLSRAGATSQDLYAQLFLFQDLQLLWVIGAAVVTGTIGMSLLRVVYPYCLIDRGRLRFQGKPMRAGLVGGSLLFGVGWGISGACPGSAPAMLGEGKVMALFAVAGISLGTYLYGRVAGARGHIETVTGTAAPAPAMAQSG
jgi:uncharacterized membrane protein YedE/YeeE